MFASPRGPFRREFWRSPIRGPWLTAVLSLALLVGFPLVAVTGLASYAAYNPWLGQGFTDLTPDKGFLGFYLFSWPTRPAWLYWLNQSLHVLVGIALIPILLAKLWSVLPKLFIWPPATTPAHALERATLLLLVASAMFEIVTGVTNIQYLYAWPGSFYRLHLYGGWIFVATLVLHVGLRGPALASALRGRSLRRELRAGVAETEAEPRDAGELVSPNPATPTISRRAVLVLTGSGSLALLAMSAGQTGVVPRQTALFAPRGQALGHGPNDFPINKTASSRGVTPGMVDRNWMLELRGQTRRVLTRAELLAMPQHTYEIPIACVEGWSTGYQRWTGVRLADLGMLVGADPAGSLLVESLQRSGAFGSAELSSAQVGDPMSLLALRVNRADLSLDHGFPARVIVPAAPGVHQTKWVSRMTFQGE